MASGYLRLPDEIKHEIDSLEGAPFMFGSVRPFSESAHQQTIERLHLADLGDGDGGAQGLPPASLGRWSRWNIVGWTKIWRNLPKVSQTFTHEVPNYRGDGFHDISQTRQVWQKSRWFGEQLEAHLFVQDQSEEVSVGLVGKTLHGPFDEAREHEFRYAASLSREWFGQARVLRVGEDGLPEIPDSELEWDPLPPGTLDEIREYVGRRYGGSVSSKDVEIMIDRFERVESLGPESRLIGTSGMQRYIGYLFGDDFVAFENARVGNALYVLRGDWEALSHLSRTELLANRQGEFDRIIHTAKWFDRLRVLVYDYRHGERA